MNGSDIKNKRQELRWNQSYLAEQLGYTQAYISNIEQDKVPITKEFIEKFNKIVTLTNESKHIQHHISSAITYNLPEIMNKDEFPGMILGRKETVQIWKNPVWGGDFAVHFNIGDETLLFAGDVAGSGPEVTPLANFICGWLRGRLYGTESRPGLRSLILSLSNEMKQQKISVSLFACVHTSQKLNKGEIKSTIESISCGFPDPFIIEGPPFRERSMVDTVFPPLPLGNSLVETKMIYKLPMPFRIVIASDGFLSRIGIRDELQGKIRLIKLFQGKDRDKPLSQLFTKPEFSIDDEICVTFVPDVVWVEQITFNSGIKEEIVNTAEAFENYLTGLIQDNIKRAGIRSAIEEAIINTRNHINNGEGCIVKIRWKDEESYLRVEIEDQGSNVNIETLKKRKKGGIGIMKGWAKDVDFRLSPEGGLVVSMIFKL